MSDAVDKPVLIIHEGEKAGQRWTIRENELVIGRGGECDLVLPERQVSREHIRIFRADDGYFLEDLDSKNGTWVNGKQVKATTVPLRDGDEIQIALAVKITFVGSEATAPLFVDELLDAWPAPTQPRLAAGVHRRRGSGPAAQPAAVPLAGVVIRQRRGRPHAR